jgi:hypothetical protein
LTYDVKTLSFVYTYGSSKPIFYYHLFSDKGGSIMYNAKQICEKITSTFSDIGECGIDINVNFDQKNNAWAVSMKKGNKELKTYIESLDAKECIDEQNCLSLGWQIAQLKNNIKYM